MPNPVEHPLAIQACKQKVADMRPVAGGRHCQACQRTIVDLRYKTNEEILAMLRDGQKVCGVINNGQMPRSKKPARPPKPHSAWRKRLLAFYSVLSLAAIYPQVAKAQQPAMEAQPSTTGNPADAETIAENSSEPTNKTQDITLRGTIFEHGDTNADPLPFCNVFIPGTNFGTETDQHGDFILQLKDWPAGEEIKLVARYIGFDEEVVVLPITDYEASMDINLGRIMITEEATRVREICITAGIVVDIRDVPRQKRVSRWWQKIKQPFRKKH